MTFVVRPGMNARAIAGELVNAGILPHPWYFAALVHQRNASRRLKSGEYRIRPGSMMATVIDDLVNGNVVQHPVTLVEGWTFGEFRHALESARAIVNSLKGLDDAEVMRRLGHDGKHPEGRFFPDTYHVTLGTTDVELLTRAHGRMAKELGEAWAAREPDLPYQSPDEALVMASIIEKETAAGVERPLIAGVFVRRLLQGMKLQTDPTVIYGLGHDFDGNLTRGHLEQDGPYNTYRRSGLPPTPIAMPGRESILAALHPAGGDALYFVARGDGSHEFSATLEQHNAAVARFQKRTPKETR